MAPAAPYVAAVPIFTWTGPYIGINGGYVFNGDTKFDLSNGVGVTSSNTGIGTTRPSTFKNKDDGFTAGGQIGYNYQVSAFSGGGVVVGVEADGAYTDLAKTGNYTATSGGAQAVNNFRSGLNYLGTVRGRIGFAFNQFLVYGTGGFAYGDAYQKTSLYTAGNSNLLRFYGSHGGTQTGYAYGGGIEYALPTNSFLNFFRASTVTIKAEYLHYDLGSVDFAANQVSGGAASAYNIHTKVDGNLARVGLNYKF